MYILARLIPTISAYPAIETVRGVLTANEPLPLNMRAEKSIQLGEVLGPDIFVLLCARLSQIHLVNNTSERI